MSFPIFLPLNTSFKILSINYYWLIIVYIISYVKEKYYSDAAMNLEILLDSHKRILHMFVCNTTCTSNM